MSFKQNKKGGKSQRTVDVSADGGQTHSMTPEAAARYLQQATSNNSNREVKISFGPSRPPSLEALKETAAREGLPCTEAEMKALMGMFVEIMGMGMDGKKGGSESEGIGKTGPLPMMFGRDGPAANWPDHESLIAATAGLFADGASWDAIRKTYGAVYQGSDKVGNDYIDDNDDDYDSIPDLDDMAARDWEVIGKMAVEGTFEAQERPRKAAKSREKKHRKKQRQREDAAAKAAEDAQRQRENEIMSWRSQVVLACQSLDAPLLDNLIDESPFLDDEDDDNDILPHLEYLLPYALPKSRNHVEKGKGIRCKLASYLLDEELHLAFEPMQNGRPILHAACFLGDLALVELVLDKLEQYFQSHANDRHSFLARDDLDITCADAGWSALHYAAMSGSPQVLEVLLRSGCSVSAITDPSFTCTKRYASVAVPMFWDWISLDATDHVSPFIFSDRKGIKTLELIDFVKDGIFHDALETHGFALQDIQKTFLENHNDRKVFSKSLENASKRIHEVEVNGYIVPGLLGDVKGPSGGAKKRKKKKKKNQEIQKDSQVSKEGAIALAPISSAPMSVVMEAPPEDFSDPLVTALLGMGFANDVILAAVKACGGSSRATADDLVTWILGQCADSGDAVTIGGSSSDGPSTGEKFLADVNSRTDIVPKELDEGSRAIDEKQRQEEVARRLAEKREEQRRRNREWNNREQARQQQAKVHSTATSTPLPPQSQQRLIRNSLLNPTLQTGATINGVLKNSITSVTSEKKPDRLPPAAADVVPLQASSAPMADSEFPSLSQPAHKDHRRRIQVAPVAAAPIMTASNSFPALGDDDRTISSFGSNHGLSISSAPFLPLGIAQPAHISSTALAPPGFMQSLPSGGQHPWRSELNENDMRLSAAEFVPAKSVMGNSQPQQPPSRAPLPSNFGLEALLGSVLSENRTLLAGGDVPLSQGFLGPSPVASFVTAVPSKYEQIPSVIPLSKDNALNVGSSLAAIPDYDDPSAATNGGGTYGLYFDSQAQRADSSSILAPTFTSRSAIEGDSLWGLPPHAPPSLIGSPLISYGSTGLVSLDSSDEKGVLKGSWVAPSTGSGHGGSIW